VPTNFKVKILKIMNRVKAAIFDMDGVIVDNDIYHIQAWAEFCKKKSIPFNESTFRAKFFGKNTRDTFHGLLDHQLTEEQINILGEEKEKIYRDIYKDHIAPVNGLIPFLISLQESGIKTAVATSAPTSNLDFTLDNLKIRHLFDILVDATGIIKGKPNPEIYLKAAKLLGIPPSDCIVFEDSISGINSGLSAGMRVIALATTHRPEELPKTSLIINDFTEISVKRIIETNATI
jgi:beta-phosphoglucomutase